MSGKILSGLKFSLLGLLFLFVGCQKDATPDAAASQTPTDALEKTTVKGPVKVTVRVTPKKPHLADLVDLDLIVTAPVEVKVKPPTFGEAVGEFLIRKFNDKTVRLDDGMQTRTLHYQLEPTELGIHLIRTMSFEFVDSREKVESQGKTIYLETEPLEVEIVGELGDATPNLSNLEPMKEPLALPPEPWPMWVWITAASVLAVVLAGGAGYGYWWMSRKPPQIVLTPAEIAQLALKGLLAENLTTQGLYKEFYIRLTGIVRIYIEQTTGLHAPEQTTEEFMQGLRSKMIFSADRAERLVAFLEAADMVKYAGVLPEQRQTEEAIARAQEFVRQASTISEFKGDVL